MRATVSVLLVLAASVANAQQSIYVGVGAGNLDYSEDLGSANIGTLTDEAIGKKLFGGFEFNDNFTMEISYRKTDEFFDQRSGTLVVNGLPVDATVEFRTEFTITGLNAVGQIPFEWGALLGGLGYFTADNDYQDLARRSATGTELGRSNGSTSDNGLTALLGIEWRFGRFGTRYGVRLEYEWWDMDDIDLSSIGLAFSYGF